LIFLLALVISFLLPQAERAIVIEDEGVISGLRRGWNVLTKNLGPILIIWFILMVLGIVAGTLLALPILAIVFPAAIAFILGGNNPSFAPLIIAGLCLVAYIPISVVANGILTSYFETVWSLAFLRLTRAPSIPHQADLVSSNA
jgi:hypothetical protein